MNPTVMWLPVGGDCNCRCEVCDFVRLPPADPEQSRTMLEALRPPAVMLHGPGEPTLHPDLAGLVHAVRRGGVARVGVVTNGRLLAYPDRAAALASLRLSVVAVTLLDPDPAEHDRLARAEGAASQSLAGLANLARLARSSGTKVVARLMIRPGLRGKVDALARKAVAAGAEELWFDGPEDEELSDEVRALQASGATIRWRAAVEALLSAEGVGSRTADGAVPVRFHPGEGAVSLVVRTGCRNACSYCTTRIIQETNGASWPLDDLDTFLPGLRQGRERGLDRLRMVAIEPLEHPDLPGFIRAARDMGYTEIEAWTSARALSDAAWSDELASAGLTHLDVPLFGHEAELHDAIARVRWSFAETLEGLENAVSRFDVRWHLVLVTQNLPHIADIVDLAEGKGLGRPVNVLVPSPSSDDRGPYEAFAPRLSEIAAAVAGLPGDLRDHLLQRGLANQLPPCVVHACDGLALDPEIGSPQPRFTEAVDGEPGADAKRNAPCPMEDLCAAAGRCGGVHPLYLAVFGPGELRPFGADPFAGSSP